MKFPFSKYHGAGNDFILIDDRVSFFPVADKDQIRKLCDRRLGIGADGLILLQHSQKADFRMRLFNADGGEPGMCGNGIRCLVAFAHSLGIEKHIYHIETDHAVRACQRQQDKIAVSMGPVRVLHRGLELALEHEVVAMEVLHTGVPHAVIFVDDLDAVDVASKGREIRYHSHFSEGVNVNFAMHTTEGHVRVRTYERGVEAETLACGTGAVAVAAATNATAILTASGEMLEVRMDGEQAQLIGPAQLVFKGEIDES
jgi:diaminopimelate epimerase